MLLPRLLKLVDSFLSFFAQAPDLLWETKFIELGRELDKQSDGPILSVDVSAVRR